MACDLEAQTKSDCPWYISIYHASMAYYGTTLRHLKKILFWNFSFMDCHWTLKIFGICQCIWVCHQCSFMFNAHSYSMLLHHHLCLFYVLGWTLAFLFQNLFCNSNIFIKMCKQYYTTPPNRSSIITIYHYPSPSHVIHHFSPSFIIIGFCLLSWLIVLFMEPVLGYAFAVVPCIQSWCLNCVVIHQVQPNIDVPKELICFSLFSDST